jgi:hypothetical protein
MIYKIATLVLSISLLASCADKETTSILEDEVLETYDDTLKTAPDFNLIEINKPVFFDYTSTGCPGCGSWGAPTFERLAAELGDEIVPMAIHIKYGDPMITEASEAIAANRIGQRYTPQLWVNNSNGTVLNGNRIDGAGSEKKLREDITAYQDQQVQIAIGVSTVINKNTLTVRYKTKAITELYGDYYLGLYILEDGILYAQSNAATNPFEHNYVLRTSNNGGFGNLIAISDLGLNNELDETFDFEIDASWDKNNLSATAIIWKKNGNNYVAINAYSSN